MAKKKIALFGGTFDPIHIGHTTVADAAARQIGAGKVVFIPAKRSPLKHLFPQANENHRYAMTALAISGNEIFEQSDYELKKKGPDYTLETVRHFKGMLGRQVELYWLAGADSIADFPHWYGITELIDECNLSVMYRAGFAQPDFSSFVRLWGAERVEKLRRNIIKTPLIDVSSTKIRSRTAAGKSIDNMVHPKVLKYIREQGLYRSPQTE